MTTFCSFAAAVRTTACACFSTLFLERALPRGGGGTPIHYLYGYVPPNGVVILKLLV